MAVISNGIVKSATESEIKRGLVVGKPMPSRSISVTSQRTGKDAPRDLNEYNAQRRAEIEAQPQQQYVVSNPITNQLMNDMAKEKSFAELAAEEKSYWAEKRKQQNTPLTRTLHRKFIQESRPDIYTVAKERDIQSRYKQKSGKQTLYLEPGESEKVFRAERTIQNKSLVSQRQFEQKKQDIVRNLESGYQKLERDVKQGNISAAQYREGTEFLKQQAESELKTTAESMDTELNRNVTDYSEKKQFRYESPLDKWWQGNVEQAPSRMVMQQESEIAGAVMRKVEPIKDWLQARYERDGQKSPLKMALGDFQTDLPQVVAENASKINLPNPKQVYSTAFSTKFGSMFPKHKDKAYDAMFGAGTSATLRKTFSKAQKEKEYNLTSDILAPSYDFTAGTLEGAWQAHRKSPIKTLAFIGIGALSVPVASGIGATLGRLGVAGKAINLAVSVGMPTLYGSSVYARMQSGKSAYNRGLIFGDIAASEALPMVLGGSLGQYSQAKIQGWWRTRGRTEIPASKIVEPYTLEHGGYPKAPRKYHMAKFESTRYRLPSAKKEELWHATANEWKFTYKITYAKPGYHELPGLFGAPSASPEFLEISSKSSIYGTFKKAGKPTLYAVNVNRILAGRTVPAKMTKDYPFPRAWSHPVKKGTAYLPFFKTEVEAVIPVGTKLQHLESKYFFRYEGVRVPIDKLSAVFGSSTQAYFLPAASSKLVTSSLYGAYPLASTSPLSLGLASILGRSRSSVQKAKFSFSTSYNTSVPRWKDVSSGLTGGSSGRKSTSISSAPKSPSSVLPPSSPAKSSSVSYLGESFKYGSPKYNRVSKEFNLGQLKQTVEIKPRKYKYEPDIVSKFFGLYGKIDTKKAFTGLEQRPLLKSNKQKTQSKNPLSAFWSM